MRAPVLLVHRFLRDSARRCPEKLAWFTPLRSGVSMNGIGVVVIGRNEEQRLRRCLASVAQVCFLRVYVDSGSKDSSVGLARSMGWNVLELDRSVPFSAARGRNEGFQHLVRANPEMECVQFVDGDCELEAGWLEQAARELEERADVAVVTGRLRERHPEASIYNRLCDLEWNKATGEVESSGGIFMVRARAFRDVGGFDPAIVAGEEPELCLRLRRRGGRVLRLPEVMAWHDADMRRLGQWWRRSVRCGRGYAAGARLHGRGPERHYVRPVLSALLWGLVLPAIATAAVTLAAWYPGALVAPVLVAAAYGMLWARAYRYRAGLGDEPRYAALYASFCVLSKWPTCWGVLLGAFGRRHSMGNRPDALTPAKREVPLCASEARALRPGATSSCNTDQS